jgi:hypothetical protein
MQFWCNAQSRHPSAEATAPDDHAPSLRSSLAPESGDRITDLCNTSSWAEATQAFHD